MASEEVGKNNKNHSATPMDGCKDDEHDKKAEFKKGYCLYKHITNRPPTSPTEETSQKSEKTVMKFLKEESALNKDFSLSLIKTDLKAEQEAKLREFLIKRLSRSTIYSSSGSLATLSSAAISEKPVTCYYKLIKGKKLDLEKDDENKDKTGYCSLDFLLCLVVCETNNMHLFQHELEKFCQDYELALSNSSQTDSDASEIFSDVGNWYDINGLLGQKISVTGCDRKFKEDILRFVDVCSLSNLLSAPVVKESNHKLLEDLIKDVDSNELIISETEFEFKLTSENEMCEVCYDWAKTMVDGEQDDPVFLKQVVENYKLKVIQDMNSLKRLLREAETDHYALFRAYLFLSKCRSNGILMEHIRHEAKMSMSEEICDVIDVLDDFIVEKGGFSKIRLSKEK